MIKILVAAAAVFTLTSCSSTRCVKYYNDGTISGIYTDDVFIGTLKDLGLGTLWWPVRIPMTIGGPRDVYWNPRGPYPAP